MDNLIHQHSAKLPATASVVAGLLAFCTSLAGANFASATTAFWSAPALDIWSYQFNSTPGFRVVGSTFRGAFELDANQEFVPETELDPSRRAINFFAFDTATEIPTGLTPTQYEITSITMTVRHYQGAFGGQAHYSETHDTPAGVLAEMVSGNYSPARPIELFGMGLRQGYTGFAFADENGGEQPYAEGEPVYTTDGYIAYPLVGGETPGEYHDVSNNITGGFSETASGNFTAPFDAASWAIGKTPGLSHGDPLPDNTTFTFEIDLQLPGVLNYVQESLSTGALGFSISSLNQASEMGAGENAYPQWFMKEAVGIFPNAEAATLEIQYAIVDIPSLPGDFNGDGYVDGDDLAIWETHFAGGDGADADGDGVTDGHDFLIWQRNYTGPPAAHVAAVPEPNALVLLLLGSALMLPLGRKSRACHSEGTPRPRNLACTAGQICRAERSWRETPTSGLAPCAFDKIPLVATAPIGMTILFLLTITIRKQRHAKEK